MDYQLNEYPLAFPHNNDSESLRSPIDSGSYLLSFWDKGRVLL